VPPDKVKISGHSMWPNFKDGEIFDYLPIDDIGIESLIGSVVVVNHPYKENVKMVKRVRFIENGKLFLEGDNPDPNASQDSHNFGLVKPDLLIGVIRQQR